MPSTSQPGSTSLFAALDRSQVQRGIKRSRRDGVAIRRGDQERDLTEIFYDLHLHTRRRHGIPVQPRRFFELLWRRILEPGHGFLSLAYSGRIPVAGAVFLIGRETLTYKYSASRPEFWRVRPNHALIWHAMEWACANGFRTFDFGLTHFPNRGLRDFKRRWAAREEVLHRSVVADTALPSRSPYGPARACARSRRPARTALVVPGHRGTLIQACRLTEPPHRTIRAARGPLRASPARLPPPQERDAAILYLLPRFPVLSQTFVLTEWSRTRRRFRTELASLFAEKTQVIHPLSVEASPHVHFVPLLRAETLFGNLALLARRPRLYLRTFMRVVAGSYRRPAGGSLKGVLVFVKAAALARLVERLGVRHVHAHFIHHPATAAWAIHRLTGVSFSVTAHADDLFIGPALLRDKVSAAAFVATISEYNRSFLERLVPGAGRIEVVHCGVDPRLLPYRERKSRRRVVCVARLEPKKGHRDLLHAIALAKADVPGLSLDLVGEGDERDALVRLRDDLGLTHEVRFHGPLPSQQVHALLYDCDLFALPAVRTRVVSFRTGYMDGIPVSLMEAMATGLPVVATSISGIPELVIDGQTGILVAAGDVQALASAIVRLCEEPELGVRLARRARSLVVERFNIDVESDRLAGLFESTMPKTPAGETAIPPGDERSRPHSVGVFRP